jgi:NitT/TauT family transport system permease protein
MSRLRAPGTLGMLLSLVPAGLALFQPFALQGIDPIVALPVFQGVGLLIVAILFAGAFKSLEARGSLVRTLELVALVALAAGLLLAARPSGDSVPGSGFWLLLLAVFFQARTSVQRLAALDGIPSLSTATAALFGAWGIYFWQILIRTFDVPKVLLPAPTDIVVALFEHAGTLGGDFVQTVLKSVLIGYTLGCSLGIGVGFAIDRSPFLQRGLLPLAALTSTIPLVGVAPIAVMWFGFDWPSKAAVIILMTFFPALVSTLAGLQSAGKLERELMHSYAASANRTLLDLRLPAAMPFIFSALKVNATLALIGAIVAEFFGSPTSGLGFRISIEATRMNMPLVWSAIVVASIVGSALYAVLVHLERRINFWHPSIRSR